ncbi:MAG TPA: DUF58 domain-containing protein [Actinomycetota bacterium]|nr:DUF58 domain-containing protein [Actinomycetota bacterium]
MPSGRGVLVFAAGLGLWVIARITGSATIHMVAVGLAVLPFAAALFARWGRLRLRVRRRLSDARVRPGQRVTIDLEVENQSPVPSSFLLLEDHVPQALGRSARLVIAGMRARGRQHVSYTLTPQRRGRYTLGPLTVDLSDPFALTRVRVEFDEREELVVTPEVEDLVGGPNSPFGMTSGLAMARNLFRTGDEFYTMRPYVVGDDLRRIHWPSVARSGELMIRQDESTRRSTAVMFVDTREAAIGQVHTPAFEKAVSAAASVGVLLVRYGFTLRLATSHLPPQRVSEELLLDTLAGVSHHTARSLSAGLGRLRIAAAADTTLVVVSAPPPPTELSSLVQAGTVFGPKVAVLVHPTDPTTLPPERREQLEGRATQAQRSLSRSGWEVVVLTPTARLADLWHAPKTQPLAHTV